MSSKLSDKIVNLDKALMRTMEPTSRQPNGILSLTKWDQREGTGPTLLGFYSSRASLLASSFTILASSCASQFLASIFVFVTCISSLLPLLAADDEMHDRLNNSSKKRLLAFYVPNEIHFTQF